MTEETKPGLLLAETMYCPGEQPEWSTAHLSFRFSNINWAVCCENRA